ncbi:hypothetical protein VTN77DRAFT_4023 [Rasamsonia byssochlamydoides]|uniref:uncharacterized protein n=1 Tax=Rasamsonia byssochlamydoides TaxID=89139 RepID=UPI0037445085
MGVSAIIDDTRSAESSDSKGLLLRKPGHNDHWVVRIVVHTLPVWESLLDDAAKEMTLALAQAAASGSCGAARSQTARGAPLMARVDAEWWHNQNVLQSRSAVHDSRRIRKLAQSRGRLPLPG